MKLDGIMFDHFLFYPFVDRIMRDKESVCPCIFYVLVMHVLVKGDVFVFIGRRHTNNWMVLCESHQDWF